MLKKQFVLPIISILAAGGILVGATQIVHAQQNNADQYSGLTQAIAQKFNLNQTDVQTFINQYMQQTMQQREKSKLDTDVTAGKITADQEQAILTEQTKLQNEYKPTSFKNTSQTDRKQTFQKEQAEIKAWSQSTGISASYLMPGFGGMHKGGNWHKPIPTPTP